MDTATQLNNALNQFLRDEITAEQYVDMVVVLNKEATERESNRTLIAA